MRILGEHKHPVLLTWLWHASRLLCPTRPPSSLRLRRGGFRRPALPPDSVCFNHRCCSGHTDWQMSEKEQLFQARKNASLSSGQEALATVRCSVCCAAPLTLKLGHPEEVKL